MMSFLSGIAASPGYAVGPLHRVVKTVLETERRTIPAAEIEAEIGRFRAGVDSARRQIQNLAEGVEKDLGAEDSAILTSQLLILDDELTLGSTIARISSECINAEAAFKVSVADIVKTFTDIQDSYYRERILDLRDVEERVLRNLLGRLEDAPAPPPEGSIVAAADLTPSDTAAIGTRAVGAFLLGGGSRTSHVAILSRSLGLPAVVGLGQALDGIPDGTMLAVDGGAGEVHLDPDPETLARFEELSRERVAVYRKLRHLRDLPAETPDGRRVALMANIELPIEADTAIANGAEGVGLLRTEYLYFQHKDIPSEDEQVAAYTDILKRMDGRPVVLRTLDVGGDKVKRYLGARGEFNPFLGWRGIRFLLASRTLMKAQLRAMFRAAAVGPARIMFPMITGLAELRSAREICRECCDELAAAGIEHDPDIQIGIMMETPSAALTADLLGRECDFFSFGTNDLIQYTLAMDRLNSRVAYLYQPLHPAVLRSMRSAIEAAHAAGIWTGICGEMASETRFAEVLLGLGFDEISLHAAQLPKIKQVIRWTTTGEARDLVDRLLEGSTAEQNEALLTEYIAERKRSREQQESKP